MKKQIIFIATVIIMLTASAVYSQSQITRVNIPFDFEARGQKFPAGEYVVRATDNQKVKWLIAGKEVKSPVSFLLAKTVQNVEQIGKSKLMFRQYDDRYFLVGINAFSFQVDLLQTKEEKLLQRQLMANNKLAKPEIVMIESIQ